MPFKLAIFVSTADVADVLTRIPFFASFAGCCVHVTRGRDIVWDDAYARKCFSESEGTRLGGPGQKAQPSMNEFALLWSFA